MPLWDLGPMEGAFRTTYNEIQKEREKLDRQREEWVREQVEPFLQHLSNELDSAQLPAVDREALQEMFKNLRKDTYFPGIISTAKAAKVLGRSTEVVRRQARKGTLGLELNERNYVFNQAETEAFAKIDRPPGRAQTKRQKK